MQSQERKFWQESKIWPNQANWIQMEAKFNQGIIILLENDHKMTMILNDGF